MSLTTTRNRKPTTLPRNTGASSTEWTSPAAWLPLPDISATNNRFVGLLRIDQESNFVALNCTVTGGYTVDWGDGTTTNHSSAANAEKQYSYSSVPNTGESTLGYRQVVITVYPQTVGQNITAFSLQVKHSQSGLSTYHTPWLNIAINAAAITSLSIGGTTTPLTHLQQAIIYNHACTSFLNLFNGCRSLRSVPLFNTSAVTNMSSMFAGCITLTTVPLFNTSAVTNMSTMFSSCVSLTSVPLFNTSAVTNMSNMFTNCSSLTSVPLFNTSAVTSMGSMFNGCSALTTIPALVSSVVTAAGLAGIFTSCVSLSSAPFSGTNQNISYANCKLSAAALNAIYTGLSSSGTGKTITVTGNWGTATHDPSIATAKGWTVVV